MGLLPKSHIASLAIAILLASGLASSPALMPCAMAMSPAPEATPCCCPCCGGGQPADQQPPGPLADPPGTGCGDAPCTIGSAAPPDRVFLPTTTNLPGPGGDPAPAVVDSRDPLASAHPLRGDTPLFEPIPSGLPRYLALSVLRI